MRVLLLLCFFITSILFSQEEKRLALVIGNSNYDKGALKNPVNDARLIASTLESLNFDIILKENLSTRTDFIRAVREFGKKRPEYDIAFVYYAGHGVQVDDENFLIPTKEEFTIEDDILDFGVSVQNIMRYLEAESDQVNILILDACRDNPFESNWNSKRSLKGGGLAKIPPPTGSLIAFSTDSGQTAPDGDGDNSIYTLSLTRNLLLEDTSIDQVFRNVRTEVLAKTAGAQRPVESTQLTGQTFYLKLKTKGKIYTELVKKVNELEKNGKLDEAITILEEFKLKDTLLIRGYTELGRLSYLNKEFKKSLNFFEKGYEVDSLDCDNNRGLSVILNTINIGASQEELKNKYLTRYAKKKHVPKVNSLYKTIEKNCDSINLIYAKLMLLNQRNDEGVVEELTEISNLFLNKNSSLYNESRGIRWYYNIGVHSTRMGLLDKSINFYKKAIELSENTKESNEEIQKHHANSLTNLAVIYYDELDQKEKGTKLLIKASHIEPDNILLLSNIGYSYTESRKFNLAHKYFDKAIKVEPLSSEPICRKAMLLNIEKKYDASIKLINKFQEQVPFEKRIYWEANNLYVQSVKSLNYYELGLKYEAMSELSKVNFTRSNERSIDFYNFTKAFILKKMFGDIKESEKYFDKLNQSFFENCDLFGCKYLNIY